MRKMTIVVASVAALLGGAALGAAGFAVFAPERTADPGADVVTATVAPGEVGSALTLNTVASWEALPVGVNRRAGVVTSIAVADGDEVAAGAVLYSVDLRPVIVAQGAIPSFRDLASGTTGADVAQLQQFLIDSGYFTGPADGRFGWSTARAVMSWQRASGVAADGVVPAGDLVYLPALPTRIVLDRELLVVGGSLAGGETLVSALSPEPAFTIPATAAQAVLFVPGMRVEIAAGDGVTWSAVVGEVTVDGEGETIARLAAGDGGTICGAECGILSPVDETLLTSQVIVVEPVDGLRIPTAAVQTRADQSTFVTDAAGVDHDVVVIASARGMSIVEGVRSGLSVRVLGAEQ